MAKKKKEKKKFVMTAWEYLMLIFNVICSTDNLF